MPSYPKKGIGDLARANIRVAEYADGLQAIALDSIRDQFAATSGLDFDRGVSRRDFVLALTEAENAGKREEFEAYLATQMAGSWTAFQQQQAAQQAAAAQGATHAGP